MAGSGRDRSAKPGQSNFPIHPKHTSSPTEINSAFASLPSIGVAAAPGSVAQTVGRAQRVVQQTLADQVTPLRLAGHLSVLLIAAVILFLSQIKVPEWELSLEPTPQPTAGAVGQFAATSGGDMGLFDNASLRRGFVFTFVDKKAQQEAPRQDIAYYTVKGGDTVLAVAEKFGLQPETLMWSNSIIEQNPDRLSIGDELRILPVDGVLHVVKPGETLSDLADEYGVEMQAIVGYTGNSLATTADTLSVGRELVIPGGTRAFATATVDYGGAYSVDVPDNAPTGSGNFSWPSAGYVSQGYWGGHPAIDIAGWVGSPVTAADGGYVVLAGGGWNGGYGNHVIIDHGNGFTTLYAHLNSIFVSPGMTVSKGQQLGTMGNTGNSTGPHLHLEVRYGGVPYNPANYLK
jgi:murein DD-endopeptidase MepM/ murein hydrolase activator NlpD